MDIYRIFKQANESYTESRQAEEKARQTIIDRILPNLVEAAISAVKAAPKADGTVRFTFTVAEGAIPATWRSADLFALGDALRNAIGPFESDLTWYRLEDEPEDREPNLDLAKGLRVQISWKGSRY